jgi:hypothetical protein
MAHPTYLPTASFSSWTMLVLLSWSAAGTWTRGQHRESPACRPSRRETNRPIIQLADHPNVVIHSVDSKVVAMGSRRATDTRIISNHPYCYLCGSHTDLEVERTHRVNRTVLSTVTGTIHEIRADVIRPRVLCASCHAITGGWAESAN